MRTAPRRSNHAGDGEGRVRRPAPGRSPVSNSLPPDQVVVAKVVTKAPLGTWYGDFSRRHRDFVVNVINAQPVSDDDILGEFEIDDSSTDWEKEIVMFPDVVEVDRVETISDTARYRVRYHRTSMVSLVTRSEVIFRFPVMIRNGMMYWEMVAKRSKMSRAMRVLEGAAADPRLVSLNGSSFRPVPFLTPTQRTLFHEALASGYYDVPRRVTLTQLAVKVSRNKSSVSKMLDRIERKLAEFAATAGA
jgi:hypothetical protein